MAKITLPQMSDFDDDTEEVNKLLKETSEHASIIVLTAYIDASLAALLQRRLMECTTTEQLLDPGRGALGSFHARASMCYVLGLISKPHYQDLLIIAEMRNYCAHNHKLRGFDDPEVKKLSDKLSFMKDVFSTMDAFQKFRMVAIGLSGTFHYVGRRIEPFKEFVESEFVRQFQNKRFI
jgi:DNA-binding MltR family transcriptional regulator